jgi:hypothetical protein
LGYKGSLLLFIIDIMSNKDPPDKYKTLKIPLNHILRNDNNHIVSNTINDAILRTNRITRKAYMLLRLWILNKYNMKQTITTITLNVIKMALKSVMKPSSGPKLQGNNAIIFKELSDFNYFTLEDGVNLSSVLNYYAITMLTAIENNIKFHFIDHVRKFVKRYWQHQFGESLLDKDIKEQFDKDIRCITNDLINNTTESDVKYHAWLLDYRYSILPATFIESYHYDVKADPQKYMKHMIFMSLELEKIGAKMFQFFPLQNNAMPRHIHIDTTGVLYLLEPNPSKYKDIMQYQTMIWNKYFSIKQSITNYVFDYGITTDGTAVSLQFIKQEYVAASNHKKQIMKDARQMMRGKTSEQKEAIRKQKKEKQEETKKERAATKKPKAKITPKEAEFKYIDEVDKELLQGSHIFIDPGKRSLLSMMDDNGKFTSYTHGQRLHATKHYKYQRLLTNYRTKLGIIEHEKLLIGTNSKSCNMDTFKTFVNVKLQVNETVVPLYTNVKFRQYRWYGYINNQRADVNMVNQIKNAYGSESIIVMGDWSISKQMRHFKPTPNLHIKRKLADNFKMYDIDEFRTSCLHHKTEEKCKNLYLPDLKGVSQKKHAILTYQMENKAMGCINRDRNGCHNIRKLFDHYLLTGTRPERYDRSYKIENVPTSGSNGTTPARVQLNLHLKVKFEM